MKTATVANWLKTPPAQWSQRFSSNASGNVPEITEEMRAMMQRGAMLTAYLETREQGGTHERGVKLANRSLVRVRRALGYSLPKSGQFTF